MNMEKEILIKRLQEANLGTRRFLKVNEFKRAYEKEWQTSLYTPEELEAVQGWGICGGSGLVLIDSDNKEMAENLRRVLPATFECLSSRRKLPHFYFKVIGGNVQNRTLYIPETGEASGEIRAKNQYLVAPGSETLHGVYRIFADRPIATLTYDRFSDVIKPFLGKDSSQRLTESQIRKGVTEGERHNVGIRYANYLIGVQRLDFEAALVELKRWNKLCSPPNNEEEIRLMVIDAINYQKSGPKYDGEANGKCKFVKKRQKNEPDMGFALELLNKHSYRCPTDTRELLFFKDGIYVSAETVVHEILEQEYKEDLKKNFVEETLAHLQRANYVERKEINKFTNKIPIQNGCFNFVTRDVEAFVPEEIFTYKLNVVYDPEAECPNFLKFLEEILPDENDRRLLQEMMGYCLVPAMPYHKLFWLYGVGRNGKGRIVATLEFILGKENCSNLNLSDFNEYRRFSLCQLYGKLLNVSSEPPLSKFGLQTNVLKQISGEDTIHAELKGRNRRLRFKNVAKPIVLGNRFPRVADNTLGWWDRVLVLNFPNSFTGKHEFPNIEQSWLPHEVSGIFNWMLEGLYRLKENGVFSSSKTTEETKTEFMRVSDPFTAWLIDCCSFVSDTYLTREEAYNSYKDYSDELGVDPDSTKVFYSKMRQTPKIQDVQKRIKGKMERIFQGISLKPESEADEPGEALSHTQEITDQNNREGCTPASSASVDEFNVDGSFPSGQFPVCFCCHKTIIQLESLTKLDGKPVHKDCKQKIDAQMKQNETAEDSF